MLAAVLSGVASAHHSFAAEYDSNQPITLTGTLTKIEWTNPHGWVYLDVKGDDGKVTNWGVEFGSPNALLRRGVRRWWLWSREFRLERGGIGRMRGTTRTASPIR